MKKNIRTIIILNLMLLIYSLSGVCSKMAAQAEFLSFQFIMYYAMVIALLGIYAIVWQQIIKKLPLSTAYANKSITIIWSLLWGVLFFNETINIGKIIGCLIVVGGIVLYSFSDKKEEEKK